MNLVGHFACASGQTAHFRVGSVLPDLLGLFNRRIRTHQMPDANPANPATQEALAGLRAGIDHHHEVDRIFHRDSLFTECSSSLLRLLGEASSTPGLKRFFPAHVLSELYFDHLLMTDTAGLGQSLTHDLIAQREVVEGFMAEHPSLDRSAFSRFLDRILADRYWEDYRDMEGIYYRMNRMLNRYGMRSLEPGEISAVNGYLKSERKLINGRLKGFTRNMQALQPAPGMPLNKAESPPAQRLPGARQISAAIAGD